MALPETVRLRVIALTAERLGALPLDEVPPPLVRFARFTPAKRARFAAAALAGALETDEAFRGRILAAVRDDLPDLVAGVEAGLALPAAPPEDVAAVAYLVRPPGWSAYVEEAERAVVRSVEQARSAAATAAATRARDQAEADRRAVRTEVKRLRAELTAARAEVEDLRRQLREARERTRRAEAAAGSATEAAAGDRAAAQSAVAAAEAEARRLRSRISEAEAAVEAGRRAAREGRSADEVRLRVLLDTLLGAATGLRRELALAPTEERPADSVSNADGPTSPLAGISVRGRGDDDPELLDLLLTAPGVHLVVDGYNVTKTGYGNQTLEAQRHRLIGGLGGLVARTGAEVTCVFDGADRPTPVALATPRGVRVLFSAPGETADELIRRLVRAEPAGRPVVVVSADREVAEASRRAGARAVPAVALLRRLERG